MVIVVVIPWQVIFRTAVVIDPDMWLVWFKIEQHEPTHCTETEMTKRIMLSFGTNQL